MRSALAPSSSSLLAAFTTPPSSLPAARPSAPAAATAGAAAPPRAAAMTSLVALATRCAALHARVDELLAVVEYFPGSVCSDLLAHLPPARLRELELLWTREHQGGGDAGDPPAGRWPFERESQDAWRARWEDATVSGSGVARGGGGRAVDRLAASTSSERRRDYRQLYWERHVRARLKARTNALDAGADAPTDVGLAPPAATEDDERDVHLFADVVRSLRVHGREVRALNVPLITALRRLERLEIHHPEQQRTCWPSLLGLLTAVPTLHELGFFHGKLSDAQLAQVRRVLCDERSSVTAVELVSVRLRPKGFREIVALVAEVATLERLRLTSSIADMDTRALVDAALRAPRLETLALDHNDLEDGAFQCLTEVAARPITLRSLRLSNNALAASTLGAISNASLDGTLALESLELTNNTEVCDAGVHALTPMLASSHGDGDGDGAQLVGLRHLDLRNCEFGLEGAMNLLLALGANRSLMHLDISQNFFGASFGDILADFLLTNDTLQALHADYIGLTDRGCTKRLCLALRQNQALDVVSLAANRLRDAGACAVLRPIVERGREKPYARVDLGGNLLTQSGLDDIARIFKRGEAGTSPVHDEGDPETDRQRKRRRMNSDSSRMQHSSGFDADSERLHCLYHEASRPRAIVGELSLLNNDFAGDSADALDILRGYVGHVSSNKWTGKRNVYDDEV